jgi:hypothetical protein
LCGELFKENELRVKSEKEKECQKEEEGLMGKVGERRVGGSGWWRE